MIKELYIKNHGPHEDLTLRFHKGINIIIGDGCSGKTDIIRSINLLRKYRPTHFKYHSHFAKSNDTIISSLFGDKTKIELSKRKKEAKYKLTYPNGEEKKFRKFKTTVPEPITTAINLHDLNIQNQLDPHYIVSESAGNVTKIINKATNIESVDKWIKKINSNIKEKSVILKDTNEELEEVKSNLNKLSNLKKVKKLIAEYKDISDKIDDIEDKYDKINSITTTIKRKKKFLLSIEKNLDTVLNYYAKIKKVNNDLLEIEEKMDTITNYLSVLDIVKSLKDKLKKSKRTFIRELKKSKKCPLCSSTITSKTISNIKHEN